MGYGITDGAEGHLSDASGYLYRVGELRVVADWNWIAYYQHDMVRLRYYRKSGGVEVQVGTVGWATHNPGSLDYGYPGDPQVGPAALEPEKRGAYAKSPRDKLYRRFAIFPSAIVGIKAIVPVLKRFAEGGNLKATTNVEETLVRFKGNEPSGADLALLGRTPDQIAEMDPAEKRKVIRKNYLDSIRLFMNQALQERGEANPTARAARVEAILNSQMIPIGDDSDDAWLIVRALLQKEGYFGTQGVTYKLLRGFESLNLLAYQPPLRKRIEELMAVADDVEREMAYALRRPPAGAP